MWSSNYSLNCNKQNQKQQKRSVNGILLGIKRGVNWFNNKNFKIKIILNNKIQK